MKKEEKRGRKSNLTTKQKIIKYTHDGKKKWNYIHTIHINEKVVIENEWDLDLIDLAIFSAISNFIHYGKPETYIDESNTSWYWISESKILSDVPLLPLNSSSAVYKRISNLVKYGLIDRKPDNHTTRLKLIKIGSNASKLIYELYKNDNNKNA